MLLRELWLQHTSNERARLFVLRVSDDAVRMLDAFFAIQAESSELDVPDFFIRFDQPFDTGFGYSRSVRETLLGEYQASRDAPEENDANLDWKFDQVPQYDSAQGVLLLLNSFATHHREQFRYVAAVLQPHPISSDQAWKTWLETAISSPIPERIRLVVIDTQSSRRWQHLADRYPDDVQVIDVHIDLLDVMRETAMQADGGGSAVGAYRQLMTDMMALLTRGTPQQFAERAEKASQIVQREKWLDQEIVLHMMTAGAWTKGGDVERAISAYRDARTLAIAAEERKMPGAASLTMQTWFGEAGAWLAAGKMEDAAWAYRNAAEQAKRIPDQMFVVEGLRMAGVCLARSRQRDRATEQYVEAIHEAAAIPSAQRPITTLPFALQDLMRLRDERRANAIEESAKHYQSKVVDVLDKAEQRARELGPFPSQEGIARIETNMDQRLEEVFIDFLKKRDRLISGGDRVFQDIVEAGRTLLYAHWSGLPEVKHPLDKTEADIALLLEGISADHASATEQAEIASHASMLGS